MRRYRCGIRSYADRATGSIRSTPAGPSPTTTTRAAVTATRARWCCSVSPDDCPVPATSPGRVVDGVADGRLRTFFGVGGLIVNELPGPLQRAEARVDRDLRLLDELAEHRRERVVRLHRREHQRAGVLGREVDRLDHVVAELGLHRGRDLADRHRLGAGAERRVELRPLRAVLAHEQAALRRGAGVGGDVARDRGEGLAAVDAVDRLLRRLGRRHEDVPDQLLARAVGRELLVGRRELRVARPSASALARSASCSAVVSMICCCSHFGSCLNAGRVLAGPRELLLGLGRVLRRRPSRAAWPRTGGSPRSGSATPATAPRTRSGRCPWAGGRRPAATAAGGTAPTAPKPWAPRVTSSEEMSCPLMVAATAPVLATGRQAEERDEQEEGEGPFHEGREPTGGREKSPSGRRGHGLPCAHGRDHGRSDRATSCSRCSGWRPPGTSSVTPDEVDPSARPRCAT